MLESELGIHPHDLTPRDAIKVLCARLDGSLEESSNNGFYGKITNEDLLRILGNGHNISNGVPQEAETAFMGIIERCITEGKKLDAQTTKDVISYIRKIDEHRAVTGAMFGGPGKYARTR